MVSTCKRCGEVAESDLIDDLWCNSCITEVYKCPHCNVIKLDDNGDICMVCSKNICQDCLTRWEREEQAKKNRNEPAEFYMIGDHNMCKSCFFCRGAAVTCLS